MQATPRALAPQEIDHELVWLVVSLAGFAGAVFWFAARLPTPQCVFHALTGFPCLTCGATRSAYQFLHGHWMASFLFNPLAFLTFCGLIIYDLYALSVLLTGAPRLRFSQFSRSDAGRLRMLILVGLAANWIYLLLSPLRI